MRAGRRLRSSSSSAANCVAGGHDQVGAVVRRAAPAPARASALVEVGLHPRARRVRRRREGAPAARSVRGGGGRSGHGRRRIC